MISINCLSPGHVDYLYNYCQSPNPVDEYKMQISIANFIYSYIECTELASIVGVDKIFSVMEMYGHKARRPLVLLPENSSRDLVALYTSLELYRHIKQMLVYRDQRLAYPIDALLRVYDIVTVEHHEDISRIYDRIRDNYIRLYNDMVDTEDEIEGVTKFIIGYMQFMMTELPMIDAHIHLLAAYIVINYCLITLSYQMFIPIFNATRIINIIKTKSPQVIDQSVRYKLTIGNYVLSGLDSSLDVYNKTIEDESM